MSEKEIRTRIVPMNADHLDELERLERICFSRPWSKRMLAEELDNACAAFLVAEDADSGKVLGYAGVLVMADEGYITNVAVFPEYRRHGIGAAIIEVFMNFARGNDLAFLTLEVRPSNTAAIALYEVFDNFNAPNRKPVWGVVCIVFTPWTDASETGSRS